jgi:hypothetical protein
LSNEINDLRDFEFTVQLCCQRGEAGARMGDVDQIARNDSQQC